MYSKSSTRSSGYSSNLRRLLELEYGARIQVVLLEHRYSNNSNSSASLESNLSTRKPKPSARTRVTVAPTNIASRIRIRHLGQSRLRELEYGSRAQIVISDSNILLESASSRAGVQCSNLSLLLEYRARDEAAYANSSTLFESQSTALTRVECSSIIHLLELEYSIQMCVE